MLSRSVPALVLGAVVALVEVAVGDLRLFAGLTALLLVLVAAGCLAQSATFRRWAILRTYELSYWDDDMDAKLDRGAAAVTCRVNVEANEIPVSGGDDPTSALFCCEDWQSAPPCSAPSQSS